MNDYESMNLKTADFYGFDTQANQLIEECAELIQAVNKYKRACGYGQPISDDLVKAEDHLVEEMADVEVMLQQIKYLLGINPRYVEVIKRQKIIRQRIRIEGD